MMSIKKRRSLALLLTSALVAVPIAAIGTVFPAGSLISTFSQDGIAAIGQSNSNYKYSGERSAVMDEEGRVIYGLVEELASDRNVKYAYVERMLESGEFDTSFDDGYITCPTGHRFNTGARASWITDMELDASGNIYALVDCGVPVVVKLLGTDGSYDSGFGIDGFLDTNLGRTIGGFWANAISIDAQDNIYLLGDNFSTNESINTDASASTKQIRKYTSTGSPRNITSSQQNFINFPNVAHIWLNDPEDNVSGLMEFDHFTNSLIFGGVRQIDLTQPADIWLSRLDLDTGSFRWDTSTVFWESGFPSDQTWYLWPQDLTVDPNGWISVGGYQGDSDDVQTPFVVQARPVESGSTFSTAQNGPIWLDADEGRNPCWIYSVMADSQNRLYTTGECGNSSFINRYRSDGTFDQTFSGNETSVSAGIQGEYNPRYLLSSGDELALFGIGSNSEWSSLAFVSKYRTSSFDDSPPPPVVVPAPVAAPAPVVAPAPAVVAAAPVAPAQPTMAIKQKTTGASLATQIGMTVTPKAKVKLTVAKASKKICKVSGGKLVALKPGNCLVTVSVTPKKTKQVKKPKTSKRSTVVRIS